MTHISFADLSVAPDPQSVLSHSVFPSELNKWKKKSVERHLISRMRTVFAAILQRNVLFGLSNKLSSFRFLSSLMPSDQVLMKFLDLLTPPDRKNICFSSPSFLPAGHLGLQRVKLFRPLPASSISDSARNTGSRSLKVPGSFRDDHGSVFRSHPTQVGIGFYRQPETSKPTPRALRLSFVSPSTEQRKEAGWNSRRRGVVPMPRSRRLDAALTGLVELMLRRTKRKGRRQTKGKGGKGGTTRRGKEFASEKQNGSKKNLDFTSEADT